MDSGGGWRPPRSLIEAAEQKRPFIGSVFEAVRTIREEMSAKLGEAERKIRSLPYRGPGSVAHAAEDGGSGSVDFEFYTVYGVKAWAASFRPNGSGEYLVMQEARIADIGIVLPAGEEDTRIRFYRETLEAWASRQVIRGSPRGILLLWDGNLTALLSGRKPWTSEARLKTIIDDAKRLLGLSSVDEVVRGVVEKHSSRPLSVSELVYEYVLPAGDRERKHLVAGFLEWLEKLESIRLLFQEAFARGAAPVFIAKTNRSRSLLNGAFPDVYYLREAASKRLGGDQPFYTEPRARLGAIELEAGEVKPGRDCSLKYYFPEPYGSYFGCEIAVIDFYARLDPGGPILRVERAYPISEADLVDPEWRRNAVEETIELIQGLPRRSGYPYPLLTAHRQASLSRDELYAAVRVLGLGAERLGRGMLS